MDLNPTMDPVSVVIPCHNEAKALPKVLQTFQELLANRPHELLVVDDGSTDGTGSAATQAGARVLSLTPNRGKGIALRLGIESARYETVVVLDGDGQDDPHDTLHLLDSLSDSVDMVIGSRFLGTLHPGSIHPVNRFANQLFSLSISLLYRKRITDSQAGYRAFRKTPYLCLASQAKEYDVETDVLLKAIKQGWHILEIPVQRYPRRGDQTDFRRIRHGTMILWTIARERLPRRLP